MVWKVTKSSHIWVKCIYAIINVCACCRFPWMVECWFSQAESGELFWLCTDLISAGSPREPQRDCDSAPGAATRPAEGQWSVWPGSWPSEGFAYIRCILTLFKEMPLFYNKYCRNCCCFFSDCKEINVFQSSLEKQNLLDNLNMQ